MKLLITGGSGFIGTELVSKLLKDAKGEVLIYDKKESDSYPDKCIIEDVRDKDQLTQACRDCQVIMHLAAEHRDDVSPISLYYDVNVGGAKNVVTAAERNGINKIIFTSSVALYGLNVGIPDETFPARPFNDYGKSKYEAEQVFLEWVKADSDRSLVIVRPVVIFGERNRGNVYNLLNQMQKKRFFMVGNGENRKSMGYVKNIAAFLAQCITFGPGVHLYNYADKPDLNMNELVDVVYNEFEKKSTGLRIPYPVGLLAGFGFDCLAAITGKKLPISSIRIKKFCANTQVSAEKIKETDFTPQYSLQEGLKRMIRSEFKT